MRSEYKLLIQKFANIAQDIAQDTAQDTSKDTVQRVKCHLNLIR